MGQRLLAAWPPNLVTPGQGAHGHLTVAPEALGGVQKSPQALRETGQQQTAAPATGTATSSDRAGLVLDEVAQHHAGPTLMAAENISNGVCEKADAKAGPPSWSCRPLTALSACLGAAAPVSSLLRPEEVVAAWPCGRELLDCFLEQL